MGVPNDPLWSLCWKEAVMAIRGNYARKTDTTYYAHSQVKAIIKSLGLKEVSEANNNLLLYCPFHSNRHTASFSISCENGAWLCYNPACGESGNLVELVKRILNKNDFQALRFISSKQNEALENFDEMLEGLMEDKPEFEEFPQETIDRLHTDLAGNLNAKEYLGLRLINKDSIEHFSLGYSPAMSMVVTPVHSPDGLCIGIVGRSIEGKTFKNSTNLAKSKTLFNIHRAKKIGDHVIIVESNFDAIRVHQAGFPNVVATLGGSLSTEQQRLLNKYFSKITIMTDSDEAGRELGMSIANRLNSKDILWASYDYGIIYPHESKDVGDMTEQEIKQCIKNAVSHIEYVTW